MPSINASTNRRSSESVGMSARLSVMMSKLVSKMKKLTTTSSAMMIERYSHDAMT
jgi:hypothetical protein